jgi:hypothetical protein
MIFLKMAYFIDFVIDIKCAKIRKRLPKKKEEKYHFFCVYNVRNRDLNFPLGRGLFCSLSACTRVCYSFHFGFLTFCKIFVLCLK